jgi:hypothetical protein
MSYYNVSVLNNKDNSLFIQECTSLETALAVAASIDDYNEYLNIDATIHIEQSEDRINWTYIEWSEGTLDEEIKLLKDFISNNDGGLNKQ